MLNKHFVLPGQVLATSNAETDGGFLRGHGTYIEIVPENESDDEDDYDVDGNFGGGMAGTSKKKRDTSSWGNDNNSNVVMHQDDAGNNKDDEGNNDEHEQPTNKGNQRLIASVAGTVERVNKLISVIPLSPSIYVGQVGDLVVGRIVGVSGSRWKVSLTCSAPISSGANGSMKEGQLPLSGVNLPGGVQRIRTSEDVLAMRNLFKEGDLLTCEVQQVQRDGTLILHTRSLRYGKLDNGVLVTVPPSLVGRRKNHFATLKGLKSTSNNSDGGNNNTTAMDVDEEDGEGDVDVYLGLNGGIWIQRTVPSEWENAIRADQDERAPLAETLQKLRQRHATTPVSRSMRESIARVRNSIDCLRLVHCQITPDSIETVARASLDEGVRVADMLLPAWVVKLTEGTRHN
jgi:exosome complex component RRP4